MTREPEWDDRARAEAIADVLDERRTCSKCGQVGLMVDVPNTERNVRWPGDRLVRVAQVRCQGCASLDILWRDFSKAHENDTPPARGLVAPGDGLRMSARLLHERR